MSLDPDSRAFTALALLSTGRAARTALLAWAEFDRVRRVVRQRGESDALTLLLLHSAAAVEIDMCAWHSRGQLRDLWEQARADLGGAPLVSVRALDCGHSAAAWCGSECGECESTVNVEEVGK